MDLKCLKNSRGRYRCSKTGYVHNKVALIKPLIFNPLVLHHYLPTGEITFSAAYDHPRPDRNIEIPVNIIRIQDISITPPMLAAPDFPNYQDPYGGAAGGGAGGAAGHLLQGQQGQGSQQLPFNIYMDRPPIDPQNQSSSSTVSLPKSETSSTVLAGNMN